MPAPTISAVAPLSVRAGRVTDPAAVTVGSAAYNPAALTLTAAPAAGSPLKPAHLRLGGGGADRTLVVAPGLWTAVGGTAVVLTVTDPDGLTAARTVTVTVQPPPVAALRFRLTALTGGRSLGGAVGAPMACGLPYNLYDTTTANDFYVGLFKYRCLYLTNESDEFAAVNAGVFLPAQTDGAATVTGLAADPSGPNASRTVANELTAPRTAAGGTLTFFTPQQIARNRLGLGTIGPGDSLAFWVQLLAGNTYTGGTLPAGFDGAGFQWAFDAGV